ncbi:MAG: Ig-like domain-containing protein, partial [Anaerolineales bacterium]|nr:Ig-like domain-containing protein [Anaerolineales bacterium]
YYPDFIVQDPNYGVESDAIGPNSYLGYLKDLKEHYKGIPLIIAEFGVPTSWGSGHLSPTGMHHGGITEEEQGQFAIRMFDNILGSGCAGGIQFSLIDEWFKQTWITNPYSDRDFRQFWHNITSPEQNFGILSFSPPPEPYLEAGSFPGESISKIKISSDYTFFRVRLQMDTQMHLGDTLWVAFDTYAQDLGESLLPGGISIGDGGDTLRAEFALSIPIGGELANLYVIPSYDVYGIKVLARVDTVVSVKSDEGVWNPVRWKTNYTYDITQYIGKMNISDSDAPYQFLNAVTVFNDSLEIRIPWTLLNITAPTVRRAMHYVSYHDGSEIVMVQEDTLTSGIAVTVAENNKLYRSTRYSWDFWDYEKIRNDPPLERKKQSFFYLKRELPQFNSPPIGFADSFEVFPGAFLELGMEEGLLSNDFDIDGNEISASLSFGNSPGHGTLHLHPDGGFNYFPQEGFKGNDLFSYYLNDGYANSTLIPVNINVGFPLGLEKTYSGLEEYRFNIYPNPGKDIFFISATQPFSNATLLVTDMTGREIVRQSLEHSSVGININDVEPGVYIFNITFDLEMEKHRVVIQ